MIDYKENQSSTRITQLSQRMSHEDILRISRPTRRDLVRSLQLENIIKMTNKALIRIIEFKRFDRPERDQIRTNN